MFKKIGLAITFSPNGRALLKEAARLQKLFDSQLNLIHIGKKDQETEKRLLEIINQAGLANGQFEIFWEKGDPADSIIKIGKKIGIDLLVAGALEKENIIKFYLGSVARHIMREFPGSSLILKAPSENPTSFKKFYIDADYSSQSEKTILKAFNFALKEEATEFVIIRNVYAPGLISTIIDGNTIDDINSTIQQWKDEEKEKMKLFLNELNLKGIETKIVCLYGKEGWEAGNYARSKNADIFAIAGPTKKTRFIDRLFPHNIEYTFEKLPSNLLIIK